MQFPYTDGFFSVDSENGFLPVQPPLKTLPNQYSQIQTIIDDLPNLIHQESKNF